jgi:hypothetical protein
MRQFRTAQLLGDGKVRVTGPFTVDEGFALKRLNFILSQKDVMVEGEGRPAGGDDWHGETDAAGLKAGEPVFAVGVAVMSHDAGPPAVQTFTWCEQIDVTQA